MPEQPDVSTLALVKTGKFLDLRPNESTVHRTQRHKAQLVGSIFAATAVRNLALRSLGLVRDRLKKDEAIYDFEPAPRRKKYSTRSISAWLSADSDTKISHATVERGVMLFAKYAQDEIWEFCGLSTQCLVEAAALPSSIRNERLRELIAEEKAGTIEPGEMIEHIRAEVLEFQKLPSATATPESRRTPPVTATQTRAKKMIVAFRDLMGGVEAGRWDLSTAEVDIVKGVVESVETVMAEAKKRLLKG